MKRPDAPRKRPKLKTRAAALARQRRRGALDAQAAWMPQLCDQLRPIHFSPALLPNP